MNCITLLFVFVRFEGKISKKDTKRLCCKC